ncbi:MAG: hypothetical protein ACRD1F_00200, partial [Terriglobales bacterium]
MRGAVLLITRDAALAQRVRRALPAVGGHEVELTAVSAWAEIADTGATEPLWLLAMLDVLACKHGDALAGSRARHAFRSLPLLWLGESPRLAAGLPQPDQLPGPIIDFLDRTLPDSK